VGTITTEWTDMVNTEPEQKGKTGGTIIASELPTNTPALFKNKNKCEAKKINKKKQ